MVGGKETAPRPNIASVRKLTLSALLAAAAVMVHSLEALLPPLVPGVPVKLGLANVFTLLALMLPGAPYALAVAVLRCLVAALISGSVSGLFYSLAGAILSFFAMLALEAPRRRSGARVSAVGESVFGAFAFNLAQLAVGVLAVGRAMLFYFPAMSLLSIPTGVFTGLIAHYCEDALLNSRLYRDEKHKRTE